MFKVAIFTEDSNNILLRFSALFLVLRIILDLQEPTKLKESLTIGLLNASLSTQRAREDK